MAVRWHIERGDIVFHKPVSPARIKENIGIFGFELPAGDPGAVSAPGKDQRTGPGPETSGLIDD